MMTTADLSPQDRAKLAREVGVALPDGRVFKRGVIVSAGDAARSAADSARNAAFDARTGQYASTNVIDPDKAGRNAYSNYLAGSNMGLMTPARTQAPFQSVPSTPAATAQTAKAYWESEDAKWGSDVVRRNREDQGLLPEYSQGGYTGPGAKNKPAGVVHAGEFVIPADKVKKIGVDKLDASYGTDSSEPKTSYAEGGFVRAAQELMSYRGRLKSPRAANYNWETISQLANDPQGQSLVIAEVLAARDAYALQLQDERDAVATGRTLATQGFIDERQQRQIEANATLADTRAAANEAKAEAKRKADQTERQRKAKAYNKLLTDETTKAFTARTAATEAQSAVADAEARVLSLEHEKYLDEYKTGKATMGIPADPINGLAARSLNLDEYAGEAAKRGTPAYGAYTTAKKNFKGYKDAVKAFDSASLAFELAKSSVAGAAARYQQYAADDTTGLPEEIAVAATEISGSPTGAAAAPAPAPAPNQPPAWVGDGTTVVRTPDGSFRVFGADEDFRSVPSYATERDARAAYEARVSSAPDATPVVGASAGAPVGMTQPELPEILSAAEESGYLTGETPVGVGTPTQAAPVTAPSRVAPVPPQAPSVVLSSVEQPTGGLPGWVVPTALTLPAVAPAVASGITAAAPWVRDVAVEGAKAAGRGLAMGGRALGGAASRFAANPSVGLTGGAFTTGMATTAGLSGALAGVQYGPAIAGYLNDSASEGIQQDFGGKAPNYFDLLAKQVTSGRDLEAALAPRTPAEQITYRADLIRGSNIPPDRKAALLEVERQKLRGLRATPASPFLDLPAPQPRRAASSEFMFEPERRR